MRSLLFVGHIPPADTGYGLDGLRSIPNILRVHTGPEVHSTSYKMSTGEFPRGLRRSSVGLVTIPHPSAVVMNM